MADFNQLVVPFLIFLFAINGIFGAMIYIPSSQSSDTDSTLFSSLTQNNDINDSITSYTTTINSNIDDMADISDQNTVSISITSPDIITQFFNLLGYVSKYLGFVGQLAFGYNIWLNYFFNPAWGPFVTALGTILKGFFFVVQLYGFIYIATALIGRT